MNSNGDHRKLIPVIPDVVKRTWNEREVLVLMIWSIAFQIIFITGNYCRRYYPNALYRIPLRHAYSLKSYVASTALGMITMTVLDSCSNVPEKNGLETLWASIILYHLCDSNNVTAYSMKENDHWFRRLGEQLLFSLVLSIYILLLSWPGCSHLPLLSIFIHLASFIKCFERVQAQRLAKKIKNIREWIFCHADPPVDHHCEVTCKPPLAAYNLFQASKSLFLDLRCQYNENSSISFFRPQHTADEVFHVVDISLGYAYDVFYTNKSQFFTIKGQLLHAVDVIFSLLIPVLGFYFLFDMNDFKTVHVAIICIVFALEVIKKIFAIITMLRSDWMDLFLIRHNLSRNILVFRFLKHPSIIRWSNTISQLDFLSVVTEEMPASFLALQKYFGIDEYLEKHRYRSYVAVPVFLKNLIHERFLYILNTSLDPKDLYIQKGGFSLKKNSLDTDLLWSINEVEFHESILIWHFATSLCYYSTAGNQLESRDRKASKLVSDYLLNVLVSKTELLPEGRGINEYNEARMKAKDILKIPIAGKTLASQNFFAFNWEEMAPRDQCKSVLFNGYKLALAFKEMDKEKDMWKVTSEVWIELLAYAAARCTGVHHSQQLRRGGEFLTHIWLMMVGFGIFKEGCPMVFRGLEP